MKQGLLKTTSLTALVLAGGMVASSVSAFAADLGGNCCSDLEERIADLEATAARKGTRKTSLEVWGQVNQAIVAWDDGISRNVDLGAENINASTRFGFRGNAKIWPGLTSGYSIMIEVASGQKTSVLSQFNDKAGVSGLASTAAYTNNYGVNDQALGVREALWWIQDDRLGRLSVGRFNTGFSGVQGIIDLSETQIGLTDASNSMGLIGSSLVFRTGLSNSAAANVAGAPGAGNFSNYTLKSVTDGGAEWDTRFNGIGYTTPTFAGFSATAAYVGSAQASDVCGVVAANGTCIDNTQYGYGFQGVVRYANEFHGVRVAGAVGYELYDSENGQSQNTVDPTVLSSYRPNSTNLGLSLSARHVPTGLFVQGEYNEYTRGHDEFLASGALTNYANGTFNNKDTARNWIVQAGISRNWFGVGSTGVYGEYGKTNNGYNTFGLEGVSGNQTAAQGGVVGGNGIVATTYTGDVTNLTMWGVGVNQNLDAAAMVLYAGYRDFSLSSGNCAAAGGCKDIGMFISGAKINF